MSSAIMAPQRSPASSDQQEFEPERPNPRFWSHQVACAALLVLADTLAITLSFSLAMVLRFQLLPELTSDEQPLETAFWHHLPFLGWMCVVLVFFLAVEGLYTQRRSLWNEVGYLTKAVGLGVTAILAGLTLTRLAPFISRATILLAVVTLLALLPLTRYWAKGLLTRVGLWRKRILILGAAETGKLAVRGLAADSVLGYEAVGLLDDDPSKCGLNLGSRRGKPAIVLGSLGEARKFMAITKAKDVLIAMPGLGEEKLLQIVHMLQPYCETIYVVPPMWGLPMMNLHVDGFLRERVMMLKLSNNLAKPWNSWLKRSLDLMIGGLLSILILPIAILITLLIKLDSAGPVFFVQDRIGYRGGSFRCIKFRTMYVNGNQTLQDYLRTNPEAAEEWRTYAKLRKYDPRITPIGRFLRRFSLDELPQLLNVLKGEMSLVGPRPYLPEERSRIGVNFSTILSARPGVTGFWQVSGRNHLTLDERVQLEAWYVQNWTVWLDCIVLAKTFKAVLFPGHSPLEDMERDSVLAAEHVVQAFDSPQ